MLSEYDVLAEARIVANNALPGYSPRQMRKLLEAAWNSAIDANFIVRADLGPRS